MGLRENSAFSHLSNKPHNIKTTYSAVTQVTRMRVHVVHLKFQLTIEMTASLSHFQLVLLENRLVGAFGTSSITKGSVSVLQPRCIHVFMFSLVFIKVSNIRKVSCCSFSPFMLESEAYCTKETSKEKSNQENKHGFC